MILVRNLIFVCLGFILISFSFSFIPGLSWKGDIQDLAVFQPIGYQKHDLIRFLASEKFKLKIKKVQVGNSSLILDFIVSDESPNKGLVYQDLQKLIFNGFASIPHIEDIRVRVLLRQNNEDQLLIGLIADRSHYDTIKMKDHWETDQLIELLKKNFQVTYGPLWVEENNSPFSP